MYRDWLKGDIMALNYAKVVIILQVAIKVMSSILDFAQGILDGKVAIDEDDEV